MFPERVNVRRIDLLMLPEDRALLDNQDSPLIGEVDDIALPLVDRLEELVENLQSGADVSAKILAAGKYLLQEGGTGLMQEAIQAVEDYSPGAGGVLSTSWAAFLGS